MSHSGITITSPAPTEHELQVQRLAKTSVERQRQFVARGWVFDFWGNCSYVEVAA
jgi:hypothetical protein